jgi:hypothetical protein
MTCSAISLELRESLTGTATHAGSWLLIEQPGPWGRNALFESRIEPDVARAIEQRAEQAGVRVQLIKRPDGSHEGLAYLVADGRTRRLDVSSPADLPAVIGTDAGVGVREPFVVVCTNARRDPCCAREGRGAADALVAAGHDVWESSHVGGHRFAANAIWFPDGLAFGRLDPATALRAASRLAEGRIELDHFRGRCSLSPPEQAAEIFLLRELGLDGAGMVRVRSNRDLGHGRLDVVCSAPAAERVVTVRSRPAQPPRIESCGTAELVTPEAWELESIR